MTLAEPSRWYLPSRGPTAHAAAAAQTPAATCTHDAPATSRNPSCWSHPFVGCWITQLPATGTTTAARTIEPPHTLKNLERSPTAPSTGPVAIRATVAKKSTRHTVAL